MTMTHVEASLDSDYQIACYFSLRPALRLIIFLHGWRGETMESWAGFEPWNLPENEWWNCADLVFVGYDSLRDDPRAVAADFRALTEMLYPRPHRFARRLRRDFWGEEAENQYEELIVAAHSLGGLIARKAVLEAFTAWQYRRNMAAGYRRPPILDAGQRLFSPASAGFRPAGFLGAFKATNVWGSTVEPALRTGIAFQDLQPGSSLIVDTRAETVAAVGDPDAGALRARIVWARPDKVVETAKYASDQWECYLKGTSHETVCKPSSTFVAPWEFVSTGVVS